jgi:hypothetical protein
VYFLTIFEHNFFLINHHESDFILVFHLPRTCTTTPSKRQPPSYGEKGIFFNKSRNAKGQKSTITTTSEAGHSLSLTSENCNYVVASMGQTPAQVPLEVESDPTIGCWITLVNCEGAAMQNRCQKAGKTTTKIKTTTNKKGRENSKLPELPDGKSTEIANKLQKKQKNSETDGNTSGNAVIKLQTKINRKRARKFKSPNNNNNLNVYKYKSINMTMTFKNPMTMRSMTSSNRNPIMYKSINMTSTLNVTLRLTLTLSGNNNMTFNMTLRLTLTLSGKNNINVYQYKTIYVTLTLRSTTSEYIADINCEKLVPSPTLRLTSGLALGLTLKSTFTHNAIWCKTSAPVFSKETTNLTGDKKINDKKHCSSHQMTLQPQKITIWQLNMHKSEEARDALVKHALNQKTLPILLLTEPCCQDGRAILDSKHYKIYSQVSKKSRPRAAIAVPHSITAYAFKHLSNRDTTVIKLEDSLTNKSMLLVSAYLDQEIKDPNKIVGPIIQEIVNITDAQKWGLLIGSDCNAHSLLWGSKKQNTRGDQVENFLASNSLFIKNTGNTPTWDVSWSDGTIIDITVTNKLLEDRVTDWLVCTDYNSQSDHRLISFQLNYISNEQIIATRNYDKANWYLFGKSLNCQTVIYNPKRKWGSKNLEQAATELDRAINKALKIACPEITSRYPDIAYGDPA